MIKKYYPVTIVTANYNNGKYLKDYFKSIMDSTVNPECVIIVDDGSTDDSVSVLNEFSRIMPNLKIVCHKKNLGFANALNTGMGFATTEYVIRLDPDDWISPDRIEKQVDYLNANKNIGIVGSNVCYISDLGMNVVGKSNFKAEHSWILKKYMSGEHGIMHGTICARKSIFNAYSYSQDMVPAEDYQIFSKMIHDGVLFSNINESLTFVRIHGSSVSNTLKFNTIKKTFKIRDIVFGCKTNPYYVWCAYVSRKSYRSALFSKNYAFKAYFLTIASLFNPKALLRRMFKNG